MPRLENAREMVVDIVESVQDPRDVQNDKEQSSMDQQLASTDYNNSIYISISTHNKLRALERM